MSKKKHVSVDIQYQVRISDAETQSSRTYEYAHAGEMRAKKAASENPFEREMSVLDFLVKELKHHAKDQKKKLAKDAKRARKAANA